MLYFHFIEEESERFSDLWMLQSWWTAEVGFRSGSLTSLSMGRYLNASYGASLQLTIAPLLLPWRVLTEALKAVFFFFIQFVCIWLSVKIKIYDLCTGTLWIQVRGSGCYQSHNPHGRAQNWRPGYSLGFSFLFLKKLLSLDLIQANLYRIVQRNFIYALSGFTNSVCILLHLLYDFVLAYRYVCEIYIQLTFLNFFRVSRRHQIRSFPLLLYTVTCVPNA